jgi:prepilin-type N-terminal cleavage/methylation domain-containing protein
VQGFSLIELLIVVAIIAALVGVAVPFFKDNLNEAHAAKVRQDLDQIMQAVNRYYYANQRWLMGTSLEPLLGQQMQEIPDDPWGNPYLFDGAFGILISYGADGFPLGDGGDSDHFRRIQHGVEIKRVQYQGQWGPPVSELDTGGLPVAIDPDKGNAFLVTLTKPCDEIDPLVLLEKIDLLTNIDAPSGAPIPLDAPGYPLTPPYSLPLQPWKRGQWKSVGAFATPSWDSRHAPGLGILVFRAVKSARDASGAQSITPTMSLDFAPTITSAATVITESYYTGADPASPIDPAVFGTQAYETYKNLVQSSKLIHGQRRGIRIERY